MQFFLLFLIFVFFVGLIVSKRNIRDVFLSGLSFLLIFFMVLTVVVSLYFQYDNSQKRKKGSKSSFDYSAYLSEQKRKKSEALKVESSLLEITKTLFYNKTCYQAWGETEKLVSDIYQKYEEDMPWENVSPLELQFLIDEGLAEVKANEVVIFDKTRYWIIKGNKKIPMWKPVIPMKRNDSVRKSTVPLSHYYYGPKSKTLMKHCAYLSVVSNPMQKLVEAREQLNYRRKLEGQELQDYNKLLNVYKKYETEGFYD